jgi:hypothetical protein
MEFGQACCKYLVTRILRIFILYFYEAYISFYAL